MLIDLLSRGGAELRGVRFILASASPRRSELLEKVGLGSAGLPLEILPSTFAEDLPKAGRSAAQYARATATCKALEVFARCAAAATAPSAAPPRGGGGGTLLIAADSVVACGERILEKPRDAAECRSMLELLSGRTHRVATGVCLLSSLPASLVAVDAADCARWPPGALVERRICGGVAVALVSFAVETELEFAAIPAAVLDAYCALDEGLDKAGGYGVQGLGAQFVSSISGCYYNAVGLPLFSLCRAVRSLLLLPDGTPALAAAAGNAPAAV